MSSEDTFDAAGDGNRAVVQFALSTRRNRRMSVSERAMGGPTKEGTVFWFCRPKGHGFITPKEGGDDLFFHITDVEGEFAPIAKDEVTYKVTPIPPTYEKEQAICVSIHKPAEGHRERWTDLAQEHPHPHPSPKVHSDLLTDEQVKELAAHAR